MSKVLGVILTIAGGLTSVLIYFLYLNSSAYLPYNPADEKPGILDVGLSLPIVLSLLILISGIAILATSREPQKNKLFIL